jgi:hypothetical protein
MPDGYVGWVKIYFDVKDAPPTPIRGGYYEFLIPEGGELRTSSSLEYGSAVDRYYYIRDDSRVPIDDTGGGRSDVRIWADYTGGENDLPRRVVEGFFVGTAQQYDGYISGRGGSKIVRP